MRQSRSGITLAMMLSAMLWAALAAAPARAESDAAAEIDRTLADCTVSQLVGPRDIPLPLDFSDDLLDHPDLAAFVVRRRGLAPYRVEMIGPDRSAADDGDGTRGVIELVRRERGRRLYYGVGEHHSRVWPVIRADAVIDMTLKEVASADGPAATRTSFLVCVRLKNPFLSGVVKLLRPFVRKTVIGKFTKAFFVADRVGRLARADPRGMQDDIDAFPALTPLEREDFRARLAGLERRGGPRR